HPSSPAERRSLAERPASCTLRAVRLCPTCRAPHRDGAECSFDQTPLAREEEDLLVGATAGDRFRLLHRLSEDAEGPLYRAVAEPGLSEVQVLVLYAELTPPAARTEPAPGAARSAPRAGSARHTG